MADGVSSRQVRDGCRNAVAQTLTWQEEHITTRVTARTTVRRLLPQPVGLDVASSGRRLQTVPLWEIGFNVHVPDDMAATFRGRLREVASDTTAFAVTLQRALEEEDPDNATLLAVTFVMGDFGSSPPDSVITALVAEIEREEATLVESILSSDATKLNRTVEGGITLVAQKIDTSALEDSVEDVAIEVSEEISVAIPIPTFKSIGAEEGSDIIVVVTPLADARTGKEWQSEDENKANNTDSGTKQTEAERTRVASSVTINLFDSDGAVYAVSGLVEPILFTMAVSEVVNVEEERLECAFWDPDTAEWLQEGLTVVDRSCSSITCATTHLTLFAAVIRGFTGAFVCSQASLLTADGFTEWSKGKWLFHISSWLLWFAIFIAVTLLAMAIRLDIQRSHLWADGAFLIRADSVPTHTFEEGLLLGIWELKAMVLETRWAVAEAAAEARSNGAGCFGTLRVMLSTVVLLLARYALGRVAHHNACADIKVHHGDKYNLLVEVLGFEAQKAAAKKVSTTKFAGGGKLDPDDEDEEDSDDEIIYDDKEKHAGVSASNNTGHSEPVQSNKLSEAEPEEEPEGHEPVQKRRSADESASVPDPLRQTAALKMTTRSALSLPSKSSFPSFFKKSLVSDITANHAMLMQHLHSLHASHRTRVEHHRGNIGYAQSLPTLITRPLLTLGPVGSCFVFSIFMRSSTRVLLLCCRVFGAVAVTTFFLSQDGVPSATNPLECKNSPDVGTIFGRLIAVAISSGLFAELPVAALSRLHRRRFKAVDFDVGSRAWHRQLRRWAMFDVVMWTIGLCYVAFCILYITLFIASVAEEHHTVWLVSTGMEVLNHMFLFPLMVAMVPTLLASLVIGVLAFQLGVTRKQAVEVVLKLTKRAEARRSQHREGSGRRVSSSLQWQEPTHVILNVTQSLELPEREAGKPLDKEEGDFGLQRRRSSVSSTVSSGSSTSGNGAISWL